MGKRVTRQANMLLTTLTFVGEQIALDHIDNSFLVIDSYKYKNQRETNKS